MNPPIKLSAPATRQFWEIPVLHEDSSLIALDKPAGLAAAPDPAEPERPSLLQMVHEAIAAGKPWVRERAWEFVMPPYAMESAASGVFLLARSKAALAGLSSFFGSEKPCQRWQVLVRGSPVQDSTEFNLPTGPDMTQPGLVRIDSRHGKRSRTRMTVVERFRGWTLVLCEPLTLRPGQIRAHLRHARCPVAGDALYGGAPLKLSTLKRDYHLRPGEVERPLLREPALHLERVEFPHPVSKEPLAITAPLPKEFVTALKYLRRFAF